MYARDFLGTMFPNCQIMWFAIVGRLPRCMGVCSPSVGPHPSSALFCAFLGGRCESEVILEG
jgi:hypothetical protein